MLPMSSSNGHHLACGSSLNLLMFAAAESVAAAAAAAGTLVVCLLPVLNVHEPYLKLLLNGLSNFFFPSSSSAMFTFFFPTEELNSNSRNFSILVSLVRLKRSRRNLVVGFWLVNVMLFVGIFQMCC